MSLMKKFSPFAWSPADEVHEKIHSSHNFLTFLSLTLGTLLTSWAFGTIEPVFAVMFFFLSGCLLCLLPRFGGFSEGVAFRLIFSMCWLMAGVAAIYAQLFNDPSQTVDASWFFNISSGEASLAPLPNIKSEGAIAIVIWHHVYKFFTEIGFEKLRYLGVLVNVLFVAFSGVIGVKSVRYLYGNDGSRLNRFIFLYSMCGMFWLYAALHLRDGHVLLAITVMTYFWTRYLAQPKLANFVWVALSSFLAFRFFEFLRTEFVFVPIALMFAAVAAVLLFNQHSGRKKMLIYLFSVIALAGVLVVIAIMQDKLVEKLSGGYTYYLSGATNEASSSSLGMALIVTQPILIRIVLGCAYMMVFPIPFWSGLFVGTAYHLFLSFNAIFFYGLIPLLGLTIWRIISRKSVRTPVLMFQLFVVLGFMLAIAGTSMETRHFGNFFTPLLALAMLPDLSLKKDLKIYRTLLTIFVVMMALLHAAWLMIKI